MHKRALIRRSGGAGLSTELTAGAVSPGSPPYALDYLNLLPHNNSLDFTFHGAYRLNVPGA
jgi:hypothetical protein